MDLTVLTQSNLLPEEAHESLAQALLDALPTAALVADTHGRIAATNPQAELLLGWSADKLVGQPVHELLECRVDDDGERTDDCPVSRLLRGSRIEPEGRMWIRCRDQNLHPVQFRCTPFPTAEGCGVIITFYNLTRQL